MGKRTRKPRGPGSGEPAPAGVPGTPAAPPEDKNAAMKRGYARSEARNEAIRQSLEPLAPGERPVAVTVAAIVAAVVGLANPVLLVAGFQIDGEDPQVFGTLLFAALMLTGAFFIWKVRYWAVMGFQALLGIILLIFGVSLPLASNIEGALLAAAVVGLGGWLFWKLVRALARIQKRDREPDLPAGR